MIRLVYVTAGWDHHKNLLTIQVNKAGHAERREIVREVADENRERDVLHQLAVLVNLLRSWGYYVHYGRRIYAPTVGWRPFDEESWVKDLAVLAEKFEARERERKAYWEAVRAARKAGLITDEPIDESIEDDLEVPGSPMPEEG